MSHEHDSVEEALAKLIESDTDGLLDIPEKPKPVTSSDRLERGFLEIVEFYRQHERIPSADTREIFERKLGARLEGFLASEARAQAVAHLDEFQLLQPQAAPTTLEEILDSDILDLSDDDADIFNISTLPKVKPNIDDDVAKREKAKDFHKFEDLFKAKHAELAAGDMILEPFGGVSTIEAGRFYVLGVSCCSLLRLVIPSSSMWEAGNGRKSGCVSSLKTVQSPPCTEPHWLIGWGSKMVGQLFEPTTLSISRKSVTLT